MTNWLCFNFMDDNNETYSDLLRRAAKQLSNAGIEGGLRDARRLMENAGGVSAAELIAAENDVVSTETLNVFEEFIERRGKGEPVSRIAKKREFWGLEFDISPDVLDPRPDTETLVEVVISQWQEHYKSVLDLGTGSGCILLSILHEKRQALGIGVDQSEAALEIAKINSKKLELDERTQFNTSNWFEAVKGKTYDVIVSNPPYIPSADIEHLDVDVKEYDPMSALDGGEDGYDDYRHIISNAKNYLAASGLIAFEVGIGQADKIAEMLAKVGFLHINIREDLSGVKRCVYATAPRV